MLLIGIFYDNIMGRETYFGNIATAFLLLSANVIICGMIISLSLLAIRKKRVKDFLTTRNDLLGSGSFVGEGKTDLDRVIRSFLIIHPNRKEWDIRTREGKSNLAKLSIYIKSELGKDISLPELRENVDRIKTIDRHQTTQRKAFNRLFSPEDKERTYKYGSAFCPECGMYKDYAKECSYCQYHEMIP